MHRVGRVARDTKESKGGVEIDLDGTGQTEIATGVPFFDHMLDQLGRHGGFDLVVKADGDLYVSEDSGGSWRPVAGSLPGIHCLAFGG